ncbi:MAG TPA: chloride channel protein [Terriglobia bacterium]|nr:chloride channel protein [Terriglobia bacterium]
MTDQPDAPAPVPNPGLAPVGRKWFEILRSKSGLDNSQLSIREAQLFLLLAIIIGLFSGLLVVCFQISIEWVRITLLGSSLAPSPLRAIFIPALGGLVVAFLVMKVFPRVRGSGVNQTKEAVYIYDGYIPFSTVIGKFFLCALAIGSGHSLGPEDPSLQIGAGVASALGRRLNLSRDKLRLLAPVGAAAGLAAAFNAPVSAVLFVIEEVIGRWNSGALGAVVLSAISGVVVERGLMGSEPLFHIPVFNLAHTWELLAYAGLGIAGGLSSVVFVKLIAYLRPRLKALPRETQYVQPAIAGLLIGVIALWLPQVMGSGYHIIDQVISEQYAWRILVLLAAFKILATTISFVSGTPGGMFAPTLFIGATVGGAVGAIERHFFPGLTGSIGSYALVGMGTLFAGFLRAPLTSVFMVLEVSGDYSIIVPVMISNTIAYLISRHYLETPIFDLLAREDGVDLPSMEEQREARSLSVEDAMRPAKGPILEAEDSVTTALDRIKESTDGVFLVRYKTGRWTNITGPVLRGLAGDAKGGLPLEEVYTSAILPVVHPDQPLDFALRQMGAWPHLPVVSRANPRKLEGVVSIEDILSCYKNAPRQ